MHWLLFAPGAAAAVVQESGYNSGYTTTTASSRSSCDASPNRERNNSTFEAAKISALEDELKRLPLAMKITSLC